MDVRLILDSGNQKGRETNLSRGIYLVGRSRICQIRPKNRYVSRKHCAIIHRKREVLIQDLGSKTGTYINRVRIDPKSVTVLQDGDRIRVGKTKFRIAIAVPQAAQLVMTDESSEVSDSRQIEPSRASSERSSLVTDDEFAANHSHDIGDVLRMLEEDDDEVDEDNEDSPRQFEPGGEFQLPSNPADPNSEDDDDSGDNVVFSAPQSDDSIGLSDPLPSYTSRKDWDVKSVYSWIEKKETFARLDQRRAKRIAKERIAKLDDTGTQTAAESENNYTPQQIEAQSRLAANKSTSVNPANTWSDRLNSDAARPILLLAVGLTFVAWVAWNAWLLISFKG